MDRLKFIITACLVFFTTQAVFSQSLKVGFGIVDERRSSASQIVMDTVRGYEQTNFSTSDPMPFVSFQYPVTDRFQMNIGVQYYKSSIAFAVDYTSETFPDFINSLGKGWGTAMRNFEFPIGGSYRLLKKNNFRIQMDLSIVPVWSIQDFEKLDIEPEGIDWTQPVIDALNASETIPKAFYMNYQYGLSVEYKRFGLTLFKTANVDRSISNGYTLYDQTYNFQRRTRSTRIGLYYSFGLKKKD